MVYIPTVTHRWSYTAKFCLSPHTGQRKWLIVLAYHLRTKFLAWLLFWGNLSYAAVKRGRVHLYQKFTPRPEKALFVFQLHVVSQLIFARWSAWPRMAEQ